MDRGEGQPVARQRECVGGWVAAFEKSTASRAGLCRARCAVIFERNSSARVHVAARDDHVLGGLPCVVEGVLPIVESKPPHAVQRARLKLAVDARLVDAAELLRAIAAAARRGERREDNELGGKAPSHAIGPSVEAGQAYRPACASGRRQRQALFARPKGG